MRFKANRAILSVEDNERLDPALCLQLRWEVAKIQMTKRC